jgi:hypothetical protein
LREEEIIKSRLVRGGNELKTKEKETKDDADQPNTKLNHAKDLLEIPSEPITRAMTKKLKETLNGFRNRFTIIKDGKTITLIPLSPKQVYDDQVKLKRECEDGKSENSREDNGERRSSAKNKIIN